METYLSSDELLKLIDINPPYFAFEGFELNNEQVLSSKVPSQQPIGLEKGSICAAEISRHLAILGVCSCALQNPVKQKHYYLAFHGIYERVKDIPEGKILLGKAKCISVDRKKAEAETELYDEKGNLIVKLRVFYHVILDQTFSRLYKNHYIENPDFNIANPYSIQHPFLSEQFKDNTLKATMGKVPESFCSGHFPNYPALPVAILVYNLFGMASKLCNSVLNQENNKTIIKNYEILADNLAFAGDHVELIAKHVKTSNQNTTEMYLEGIADGNKSIGKIEVTLLSVDESGESNISHAA